MQFQADVVRDRIRWLEFEIRFNLSQTGIRPSDRIAKSTQTVQYASPDEIEAPYRKDDVTAGGGSLRPEGH